VQVSSALPFAWQQQLKRPVPSSQLRASAARRALGLSRYRTYIKYLLFCARTQLVSLLTAFTRTGLLCVTCAQQGFVTIRETAQESGQQAQTLRHRVVAAISSAL